MAFTEMAEGNGELAEDITTMKADDRGDGERTDDYPKLIEYGLDKRVSISILFFRKNLKFVFVYCFCMDCVFLLGCRQIRRYI